MERITNCKNCGAPLKLISEPFTKCHYCGTEYYFDEEYKKTKMLDNHISKKIDDRTIEIEFYGKKRKFYIGKISFEPIQFDTYRDSLGFLITQNVEYKAKLNLIEM